MGSESAVEYFIRIVTASSCMVLILRSARSVRFGYSGAFANLWKTVLWKV